MFKLLNFNVPALLGRLNPLRALVLVALLLASLGARRRRMRALCALICGLSVGLSASGASAATFVVDMDTTNNSSNACTPAPGDCALGAALLRADSNGDADTITFDAGISTISLLADLPTIRNAGQINIVGPTDRVVTLRRGSASGSRLLLASAGTNVNISNLTLRDTSATGFGGALNNAGTMTANNCVFINNVAGNSGGAISNFGGTLTVSRCTFDNNSALNDGGAITNTSNGGAVGTISIVESTLTNNRAGTGGAIFNSAQMTVQRCYLESNNAQSAASGTSVGGGAIRNTNNLLVENCTLIFNFAQTNGGGILNESVLSLQSSTLVANGAPNGGGLFNAGDSVNIGNSLFQRNPQGVNVLNGGTIGSFVSDGYNLSNDASGPAGATDQRNTDPMLDAIASFNGGPVKNIGLQPGSPAIDRGKTTLATDARGQMRPVDFATVANAAGGNGADIGAFEVAGRPSLVVTTVTDEDNNSSDPNVGTGTSLREALNRASSDGVNSNITFASGVFGGAQRTITLGGTELFAGADGQTTITTPGPGLTLDGANGSRILQVGSGANLSLSNLTFTGGNAPDAVDEGGAIRNLGTLSLAGCTFTGNTALDASALMSRGSVSLTNCTISGNPATRQAAIYNLNGAMSLDSCTISGNSGVSATNNGGLLVVGTQSGVTTQVVNSIIAGNTISDVDVNGVGTFTSNGFNIVGSGNALNVFNKPSDKRNISNPGLATLTDNGGPTPTRALLAGSVAINAGSNAAAAGLTTDQRGAGFPRVVGGTVDIGAFESTFANRPPLLNNSTYSTTLNLAFNQQLAGSDPDGDALSYVRSAGTLPTGLSLSSSGLISGTPNTTGQFAFSVNVNDGKDTLTARFIIIVSSMADAIGPNVSRPALNASYTRDDLAALIYTGTIADVAGAGATPSGVSRLLFQLRRESDKTAYSGTSDGFTANLNRGYYSAILSDPVPNTTAGARPFKRTFSTFIPPASVLTVGPYSLVIAAQDVAGNWSIEVVPINIVAAPPVSRLKPATPSGSSALRSSKSASGGKS